MPTGVYKRTEKHKQSIARHAKNNPNYGMKGKSHSEGSKRKNREAHLGNEHTEETKEKIGQSTLNRYAAGEVFGYQKGHTPMHVYQKGHTPWNKGLPSEVQTNWQGGKSLEPYGFGWTDTLREAIRERDNHVCQMPGCGIHQGELIGWLTVLDVHHIDYDKKNCDPRNLISLCRSCHLKTNYDRDYWTEYFRFYEEQ